mmetsp:Transcript_3566/g.12557  ORF Transcript_3566/g.12557 Transcript_3566/m.12557 type:complete len:324 (+) Transcript_3566:231-1202(+)
MNPGVDVTNALLKQEFETMMKKKREDEYYNQKLNIQKKPPVENLPKKTWRFYMHVGSNGNLWSDLERMPAERRHLVLTPTVMKGQEEHIKHVQRHMEQELVSHIDRIERVNCERSIRRYALQEQQMKNIEIYMRARQKRPFSAHAALLSQHIRTAETGETSTQEHEGTCQKEIHGRDLEASAQGRATSSLWKANEFHEVQRPASALPGNVFKKFAFTTQLNPEQWSEATRRRLRTRERMTWEINRPDLAEHANALAEQKAVLEEEYLTAKQKELRDKRTLVMQTMKERQSKRAELELKSGQIKSRSLMRTRSEPARIPWRPSA